MHQQRHQARMEQQPQQIKTPLWKTRMCKFAQAGNCSRGANCQYAHDESELRPIPDFSMSSICPAVQAPGGICKDPQCRYAHDYGELREVNDLLKTKTCKFYASTKGCSLGTRCRFAHGNGVYVTKQQLEAAGQTPKPVQLESTWPSALPYGNCFQDVSPAMRDPVPHLLMLSRSTESPMGTISGQSTPDVWEDEGPQAYTPDTKTSVMYYRHAQNYSPASTADSYHNEYFPQLNNTYSTTSDEQKSSTSGTTTPDVWGEWHDPQKGYNMDCLSAKLNMVMQAREEQVPQSLCLPTMSPPIGSIEMQEPPRSCPATITSKSSMYGRDFFGQTPLKSNNPFQMDGCEIDVKNTFITVKHEKSQPTRRSCSCSR